ncbi:dTDP-glucose 4,6-dehydratase [Candidatus Woesearchaeota archaeon]|nr:dTDP-glucose 4,6-dehydratase [Candidatus Woesearchaeota archaeon]
MKILVTGGSGFIGNCFIKLLLKKYPAYHVTNLDKLTYAGNKENLKEIEDNTHYTFVHGDVCDALLVNKLMRGVDYVVNFAAESHVDRSIISSDSFVRTGIFGIYVLMEAAQKNNIKKFLHISTDEVYGDILKGHFKEDDRLCPSSPYSASKAAAEMLAHSYLRTHGLPIIITRSSNNYGLYQHPEKLIPCFITKLLQGKKVPLHNPKPVRDWIHVQDNCEAIDFVLHNGVIGEIYNVGGDNEKTNLEVTKVILNSLNLDETYIEDVSDRKGQDLRYALNCDKLHKLGWKPRITFEEGIRETIEWYKQNKSWWNKINKIVIAGANRTGHAGVVLNTLKMIGEHSIVGFLDKNSTVDKVPEYPLIGSTEDIPTLNGVEGVVLAISDNAERSKISKKLKEKGLKLVSVIHPNAFISPGVLLGEGVFIGPGAIVNSNVKIGNNVIIGAGAIINHNVIIEDNTYIGTGTVVDARAVIQENAFIVGGARIPMDTIVNGKWGL